MIKYNNYSRIRKRFLAYVNVIYTNSDLSDLMICYFTSLQVRICTAFDRTHFDRREKIDFTAVRSLYTVDGFAAIERNTRAEKFDHNVL